MDTEAPDNTTELEPPREGGARVRCDPDRGWDGIFAALAGARPGDRVELKAGDYRGEVPIRVPGGVTLAAADLGSLDPDGQGGPGRPRPCRPRVEPLWHGEDSALVLEGADGARTGRTWRGSTCSGTGRTRCWTS